jgi:hypothetical protein
MDLFLQIALSFPTLIFSVLLGVAVAYWVMAMVGLLELDVLDALALPEGAELEPGGVAGLLMKLGLDGVPVTLIGTGFVFFGWIFTYFVDLFLLQHIGPGPLRWLLGSGLLVGALILAMPLTGLVLRPLAPLFAKVKPVDSESLLGKVARVRSPDVTESRGSANLEDGGAGLILEVRAEAGQFVRGDEVVLVEYLAQQNAYRVIPRGPA